MSKELLAGIVNKQQMKIYAEETAKLAAAGLILAAENKRLKEKLDAAKERYDKLHIDFVNRGIEIRNLLEQLEQLVWIAEKAETDDSEDTTIELARQYINEQTTTGKMA